MREPSYLVALGSNRPHPQFGAPPAVVAAGLEALADIGPVVASPIISSAPVGPSSRLYANAAALLESDLSPPDLLRVLKNIERRFGRRSGSERWSARVLDLDIVLWRGGNWVDGELVVPHREFRRRGFVLGPACTIAPDWRDPVSGLSLRQLNARLTKPKPLPRGSARTPF